MYHGEIKGDFLSKLMYAKILQTKICGKCTEHTFKIFGFKFSGEFFTVCLFRHEDKYTASLGRRKEKILS